MGPTSYRTGMNGVRIKSYKYLNYGYPLLHSRNNVDTSKMMDTPIIGPWGYLPTFGHLADLILFIGTSWGVAPAATTQLHPTLPISAPKKYQRVIPLKSKGPCHYWFLNICIYHWRWGTHAAPNRILLHPPVYHHSPQQTAIWGVPYV